LQIHSHLACGIILTAFLNHFFKIGLIEIAVVLIFSVFIDLDIIMTFYSEEKNHRKFLTHTPIFWIAILSPLLLFSEKALFAILAVILHIFLDYLDWGIMLFYPLSDRFYGGIIRTDFPDQKLSKPEIEIYIEAYIQNKKIMNLEKILGVLLFLSLLAFAQNLLWLLILYLAALASFFRYIKQKINKK